MKLKQKKIILSAVLPLLLVSCVIAATVHYQTAELGRQQHEVVRKAYLATKDMELRNYVALAKRSIDHLYTSGRTDDEVKEQAKTILSKLDYGDDGYFFLFHMGDGRLLMHPRQTEKDWRNIKDADRRTVIQKLVHLARAGGGFTDYLWEQPSQGNAVTRKRAYVVELPDWEWMLGTGVYLGDVDQALNSVDAQVRSNIIDTMGWIVLIALLSVSLVIFSGWVLNIRERRDATAGERMRIARELHDGICQRLAALKMNADGRRLQFIKAGGQCDAAEETLRSVAEEMREVTDEVREISHGLHPEKLMQDGLVHRMRELVTAWRGHFGKGIEFIEPVTTRRIALDTGFVLYRVAQEALKNSAQHAQANHVTIELNVSWRYVTLTVADDGIGFPENTVHGLGLKNMEERIEEIGGKLVITSSNQGTVISAVVPRC